ncbi:hypothetical protein MKW98_007102 [Papaver atlanticum]|uniref:Uncharacterized protein n=1 Tax=Papaver atlanticum TaxID=357466 RepID=A0AAD4XA26_9MAGN|nr:hypothetical protein MKW98_030509 [Papaver atlanticum]KAI3866729.1 hypothetical protein MKW98_007102 [Papaver atlanticum]
MPGSDPLWIRRMMLYESLCGVAILVAAVKSQSFFDPKHPKEQLTAEDVLEKRRQHLETHNNNNNGMVNKAVE